MTLPDECPLCQGRGLVLDEGVARPCSCMAARSLLRRVRDAQLPPRIAASTFDDFNLTYYRRDLKDPDLGRSHLELARIALAAAKRFTADFLDNPNTEGLLFTGKVGSGKTLLAGAIANTLIKSGRTVLFMVVPDLLDMLRATFDGNRNLPYTEHDLMEVAREVPLLILDDLGAHNYTEWTLNRLYSIVNHRLNHFLPVVVTTNINLEDMQTHLGERTTSRLIQMCRHYRLVVETDIRILRASSDKEARRKNI